MWRRSKNRPADERGLGRDQEKSGFGRMRSSDHYGVLKIVLAGSPVLSFSLPEPARR